MNAQKLLFRVVLPVLVPVVAIACAGLLMVMRPEAERAAPEQVAPLVEVVEVAPRDEVARIVATGVTRPAREITVMPEVQGRLVEVSDRLVPGGRFEAGDVIARIDPRDYRLALDQEQGRVRQAELDLQLEEGRQEIAKREWELLGGDRPLEEGALALREPHLATAQQALAGARSALERARLSLDRTVLRAPFDAVVTAENVDLGQVVGPNTAVATLVGTDELWVRVSVPVEHLGVVEVPDAAGEGGSPAKVVQRLGAGEKVVRNGRLLRLMGELDPQTRTAQLLVSVDDPFGARLPLLPGAYVDVEIAGREIEGAMRVPRRALDGDAVWIVDSDDRLRRRLVETGWRTDEDVLVTSGLEAGDRVVVTPLSLPLEGMPVRPVTPTGDARSSDAAAPAAQTL